MEQKFTTHLIENGLIDKKTGNEILSLYKEKSFKYNNLNNLYFNETMTEILLSIFNNLNEIQIKYICFHLPAKFIKTSKKQIKEKLENILSKTILKKKFILSKYLFKWYRNMNKPIKNNSLIYKNIFRQKSNKNFINNSNNNKYNINENNKDFLFNNDTDNLIIQNYRSNLSTLNNSTKNKTLNNTIKHKNSIKTPKKFKFIYNKDVLNINDIQFINNINNYKSITTTKATNNKKLYTNNKSYINQMKKDNKINYKKNSNNNETINSGLRDYSNESNENCASTNLNTINNRYNCNQENKTLSHSEYVPNLDLINNYNLQTYKKINNDTVLTTQKIKEYNSYFNQPKKITKKSKIKNKSILIQNILKEDFDNNSSFSPPSNSKSKKSTNNSSNIYNLIYCNNYNNLNHNNYIYDDYNLFSNYQTPFCGTMKNSKSSKEYSACSRLFEDGKKRIKTQNQKIKEQEKYLDEMASRISGDKKNVDYQRINSLYKSKERSNTYEKTKNKVEKEEGLTFKPNINKSEYSKRIYGNFMERNLSNKSNNNYMNEYNYTNNNVNNINNKNRKKLTKKQKEKIVKGVINRLYSNSLMKSMSTCCNKYTKGINHSNLKPYKKRLQD